MSKVAQATYRGVPIKIVNWGKDRSEYPSGCWNFYLYFLESKCSDFASLWLPGRLTDGGLVTHDYYATPLGDLEWHGDLTWYEKHGHTEGHRCVEAGCDYQHYFDTDQHYTFASVLDDAVRCVDSAFYKGILK